MSKQIIIALCYEVVAARELVIANCPYCFTQHKHRLSSKKPPPATHCNGQLVDRTAAMYVKSSNCLFTSHTYALELIAQPTTPATRLRCQALTLKQEQCKRNARPHNCVCSAHVKQLEQVLERQLANLYAEKL